MVDLGNKIRKIRELKGLSQDYMADKLFLSQKQYSLLEGNKVKIDIKRIENIAAVFEVDPIWLLTFDEQQIFNQCNQSGNFYYSTLNHNNLSKELELKDELIKTLKDKINLLEMRFNEK
ncbi:MAG: helix-turn-helix transcriptional regulator [Bacteroidetes bacterium]|jgi:transcriptional regulator with XRE-family HTH domain|nr:helix-turn-helix transcriptional regulator [Bacteroidota bacterium]MBP7257029.1 helix-turn-helix transcriptional regulator [Chitinophagales bacterium]MBK7641418.1 helix-turn-helix transcriptional regulator [Bacteroidota bacterium]MBK8673438.1 helix-turn-helix transcriptional regulator [Bacteroidota bacterium]MBK9633582.1 helix-turn-helix transcriptional regulator [Bacteroidota bacterium]